MAINTLAPILNLPVATPAAAAPATTPAIAATTPVATAAPAPAGDTNSVASSLGDASQASLPSSSSAPAEKIKGASTTSIGDPHETTGDGFKFDNMKTGVFVKARAKSGDFELQTRQDPWDKNPQATVNTAAAVKVNQGGDVVKVDAAADTITFNGKPITVEAGKPFEIPGGGQITKSDKGYEVTSAAGDKVSLQDRGTYMDVMTEASPDRVDGDISGSLGALDSDTDVTNDLVGRDGKPMDLNNTDGFIEEWRAKGEEDMFGGVVQPAAGEAPVAGGEAPVGGEQPVAGAEPAVEDEGATKLTAIKAEIGKLKADPANAAFAELLTKLEELLGGAEKGEAQPQGDLQQQVTDAKPEGNTSIEALLKMIMEWLALEKKRAEVLAQARAAQNVAVAA